MEGVVAPPGLHKYVVLGVQMAVGAAIWPLISPPGNITLCILIYVLPASRLAIWTAGTVNVLE